MQMEDTDQMIKIRKQSKEEVEKKKNKKSNFVRD